MMQDFPHIRATLAGPVPDLIIASWQQQASEHDASGTYSSYATFERMFGYEGNDLAVAVANTAPHARVLEDGHSGFHLPSKIDWGSSSKARVSKRGVRYLRIPFSHGTPGKTGVGAARARTMMPQAVYADALTALRGDRTRREARAAAKRLSEAGPRLSRPYNVAPFPTALRDQALRQERSEVTGKAQPGYSWRSSLYSGLRRAEAQTGASGRSSASYYTVRTLTEDSAGWFIPPQAPLHIAAKTVEAVREHVRDLVVEAAREDVITLIGVEIGR